MTKTEQKKVQKKEYYINYQPSNYYKERGLGLADTFSSGNLGWSDRVISNCLGLGF